MKKVFFSLAFVFCMASIFAATPPPMQYNPWSTNRAGPSVIINGAGTHMANVLFDDLPYILAGTNVFIDQLGSGDHTTNRINMASGFNGASLTNQHLAFIVSGGTNGYFVPTAVNGNTNYSLIITNVTGATGAGGSGGTTVLPLFAHTFTGTYQWGFGGNGNATFYSLFGDGDKEFPTNSAGGISLQSFTITNWVQTISFAASDGDWYAEVFTNKVGTGYSINQTTASATSFSGRYKTNTGGLFIPAGVQVMVMTTNSSGSQQVMYGGHTFGVIASGGGGGGSSTASGGVNPGNGTDFSLTGSLANVAFGSALLAVSNVPAGTYNFSAQVVYDSDTVATGDTIVFRLFDATAGVIVPMSQGVSKPLSAVDGVRVQLITGAYYTLTVTSDIIFQAQNATSARGVIEGAANRSNIRYGP